jgi:hypothetical protein
VPPQHLPASRGIELTQLRPLQPAERCKPQALAAAASRAFCQSALNWVIPLSVSG